MQTSKQTQRHARRHACTCTRSCIFSFFFISFLCLSPAYFLSFLFFLSPLSSLSPSLISPYLLSTFLLLFFMSLLSSPLLSSLPLPPPSVTPPFQVDRSSLFVRAAFFRLLQPLCVSSESITPPATYYMRLIDPHK